GLRPHRGHAVLLSARRHAGGGALGHRRLGLARRRPRVAPAALDGALRRSRPLRLHPRAPLRARIHDPTAPLYLPHHPLHPHPPGVSRASARTPDRWPPSGPGIVTATGLSLLRRERATTRAAAVAMTSEAASQR